MTTTVAPPVSFEPTRTGTPGRRHRRNWAVTARSISISLRVWSQIPSLSRSGAMHAGLPSRLGGKTCAAPPPHGTRCTEHTMCPPRNAAVDTVPLGRAPGTCADQPTVSGAA
ncbi:hypothetical protein HPB50_021962 [Hyalomma asiaticum]|uniref:Uncharacterized protein n=1 Tax=Hyalomma asiaticum TaxID=266040 RepID=A0ACB7TNH0_HYAAI|nr:hypothetical protein HPB50_021962 [Hyalomma asiaticum]